MLNNDKIPLTPKQLKVYSFILTEFQEKGFIPTYQEIAEKFGTDRAGIARYLKRIEGRGWIKTNTAPRAIQIL